MSAFQSVLFVRGLGLVWSSVREGEMPVGSERSERRGGDLELPKFRHL
jgi:hypothetical protein